MNGNIGSPASLDQLSPILIAGGTGRLGTQLVRLLTARGLAVRILTRDPARAAHLKGPCVEILQGDVRDPHMIEQAADGAKTVISAVHGFAGTDGSTPQNVDHKGNSNLIQAAKINGVGNFILLSVYGAAADHPMELFRMKYKAEQELQASGLSWSIIRATAYMETWAALIGEPLLKTGKTLLFGRGSNSINFVSAYDVARYVELAVMNRSMRGCALDVGGPQNLTMRQVVEIFQTETGKSGTVNSVPLPIMRIMAVVMRLANPALAGQIQGGIAMDTRDMTFDPADALRRYPTIPLTSLAEVVRRDYVK